MFQEFASSGDVIIINIIIRIVVVVGQRKLIFLCSQLSFLWPKRSFLFRLVFKIAKQVAYCMFNVIFIFFKNRYITWYTFWLVVLRRFLIFVFKKLFKSAATVSNFFAHFNSLSANW